MGRPGREPLKDKVEVDETYIGGPEAGLRGGRELIEKALVVGAYEGSSPGPVAPFQGSLPGFGPW
jgi:hypothetical protein